MKALRPVFRALRVGVPVALLLVSMSAAAQWVWKDEAGQVFASDQPPPSGTPQSRIIKEPRARPVAAPQAVPAVDKDAKGDAPKSIADRDLESRQRQKEAAEASKKADEDAVKTKALQENCTAVKGNLAALQTGGRAARFNEKGERYYIDDSQRAAEIARSQGQIAQYCR